MNLLVQMQIAILQLLRNELTQHIDLFLAPAEETGEKPRGVSGYRLLELHLLELPYLLELGVLWPSTHGDLVRF